MYIKKLEFKNYGPVDSFILEPRFRKDGSPIPIVLMGKNGSGKTLIEAHILQAILNFKSELYNDIPEKDKSQLYKIQSTSYYIKYNQLHILKMDTLILKLIFYLMTIMQIIWKY